MHRSAVGCAGMILAGTLTTLAFPTAAAAAVTCHGKAATIVGSDRNEVLRGTSGRDVIAGLGGNDTISGRGGDDLICGGRGADKLKGGHGDDRLFGGLDELGINGEGEEERTGDLLAGGPGDDVLRPGRDKRDAEDITLDGITWAASVGAVHINLAKGIADGDGHDVFSASNIWVTGTEVDDVIIGSDRDDHIDSGPGSDVVRAKGGDDNIIVDSGRTTTYSADVAYAGAGNDDILSGDGQDRLYGGSGNDGIVDTGKSNDVLSGGDGTDHLVGQVADTGQAQRFSGGGGDDKLSLFTGLIDPNAAASTGTWDMTSGDMQITYGTTIQLTAEGIEVADFGTYGTTWTVTGTSGPESLFASGTAGTQFDAQAGDDMFFGSADDDTFDGGDGNDTSLGMGAGDDTCVSVETSPPNDCEHQS